MDTYTNQAALTADEIHLELDRAYRRGVVETLTLLNHYLQLTGDLTAEDLQRMTNEQAKWQRKIGLSESSDREQVATIDFSPLHKEVIHLNRQRKNRKYATRS